MANAELNFMKKWGSQLKRAGFSPKQQAIVATIVRESGVKIVEEFYEKAFILFLSLAGNVLEADEVCDKATIKDVLNECLSLYESINMELLDWDEVIAYNSERCDFDVKLEWLADKKVKGDDFISIKNYSTIKQRVKAVMEARDTDLKSLEEAATHITNEETKLATKCYRAEYNFIMKALKEGGIL